MKITKTEVKTIFFAFLISIAICLVLFVIYLVWLRLSPQGEDVVYVPNRVEELRDISQLPLYERRNLILTGVWGDDYYTRIIQPRRIEESPWDLVYFGVVRPNQSYDLLALTAMLLQMYPHIAMERDSYLMVLPGGMFFDLMDYHISIPNLTFLYPYGFEIPVIRMQGMINGVIIDETIDFR